MSEAGTWILLAALIADWFVGDPETLWARTGHPVAWMGRLVGRLDATLNRAEANAGDSLRNGAVAWLMLVAVAVIVALTLEVVLARLGPIGWLGEVLVVATLLAQKSLKDHVLAVADGLRDGDLAGGRAAVARIVGRDPDSLDRAGVSRAAIESLAENFSDGVVAPAFWYALLGLPGIVAYKMINTADSMIGHRSEKHLHFGRVAARADDIANRLPARLSALLVAAAAATISPVAGRQALSTALRDGRLHRSPNAGWPEAAFAGGLDIALGGPRRYRDEIVAQAHINAAGRRDLDQVDIRGAVRLFAATCFALWAVTALLAIAASA